MNKELLTGKIAVITGATSGVGRASALLFAEEGARIIATGRREERLISLKEEIERKGGACDIVAGDIADLETGKKLAAMAEERGGADVLLYSAGIALRTPTLEMPLSEWDEVFRVNVTAAMFLSQLCIPQMQKKHYGKIVFISSTAAKNVNMGASPSYGASKAALDSITRHLAREFASEHIYVNSICPGPLDTEITHTWTKEHREKVLASLPLGRMGTPEEIAHAALFFASSLSDYMSGESVLMNGGRYMDS